MIVVYSLSLLCLVNGILILRIPASLSTLFLIAEKKL
jgi:hypothetical protein